MDTSLLGSQKPGVCATSSGLGRSALIPLGLDKVSGDYMALHECNMYMNWTRKIW
jgi:hypothetical protein